MIKLWNLEQLRFFLIAVLLVNWLNIGWNNWVLIFLFLLFFFVCLDESHLSCYCEMGNWTMNHSFIEFILKQVFFNWNGLLKISDGHLAHMHDCPNIELINPMRNFINAQNRSFAWVVAPGRYKLFLNLFFIVLWVFLPVIKWWFVNVEF